MIKGSSPLLGDALSSVSNPLSLASLSSQTSFEGSFYSYLRLVTTPSGKGISLFIISLFQSELPDNQSRFILPVNISEDKCPLRLMQLGRGRAYIKQFSTKYSSIGYLRNLNSGFGVSNT